MFVSVYLLYRQRTLWHRYSSYLFLPHWLPILSPVPSSLFSPSLLSKWSVYLSRHMCSCMCMEGCMYMKHNFQIWDITCNICLLCLNYCIKYDGIKPNVFPSNGSFIIIYYPWNIQHYLWIYDILVLSQNVICQITE